MKYFTTVNDVHDANVLVNEALELKKKPYENHDLGKNKTLGLIFFNSSLRTRLSTQKAALNLGMRVVVMNIGTEGWALEYEEGAIMNGNSVEHIKDAASVLGLYCDIIAVRCFPSLTNKKRRLWRKTNSSIYEIFERTCYQYGIGNAPSFTKPGGYDDN